ncbi:uncharacterized protein EI90DRAFT_3290881 [Cantharellus anzutake]|uniref:uncharacterized protein n=1 Tax=Cantharellus anzutake TaxID=1750568 RepID=UPI001903C115|nr:uncharacterized protein EI90DRAFT_3290881 [Cantharellus anzutake]KAF8327819.1 hypothetical protein EI90DRAFT_3290881 [Cantharellus anzutake]
MAQLQSSLFTFAITTTIRSSLWIAVSAPFWSHHNSLPLGRLHIHTIGYCRKRGFGDSVQALYNEMGILLEGQFFGQSSGQHAPRYSNYTAPYGTASTPHARRRDNMSMGTGGSGHGESCRITLSAPTPRHTHKINFQTSEIPPSSNKAIHKYCSSNNRSTLEDPLLANRQAPQRLDTDYPCASCNAGESVDWGAEGWRGAWQRRVLFVNVCCWAEDNDAASSHTARDSGVR